MEENKKSPIHSVVVDFDHTISTDAKFGPPTKGAGEALKRMKKQGLKIIIHSARMKSPNDKEVNKIHSYMKEHKLPYDSVWLAVKPVAVAYIDNKAIPFSGNWQSVFDRLQHFVKKG